MNITEHPRFADLAAVLAPRAPDHFGDVSPADLARLSVAERAELLELLEIREAAGASAPADDRPPIWHFIVADVLDHAEQSDDPAAYVDAALAHERAARGHLDRLAAARPKVKWNLADRPPIEAFLVDGGEWGSLRAEAVRLAIADGFPPPELVVRSESSRQNG